MQPLLRPLKIDARNLQQTVGADFDKKVRERELRRCFDLQDGFMIDELIDLDLVGYAKMWNCALGLPPARGNGAPQRAQRDRFVRFIHETGSRRNRSERAIHEDDLSFAN